MVSLTPAATPCFLHPAHCRSGRAEEYTAEKCKAVKHIEQSKADKQRPQNSTAANIRCTEETKE